MFQQQQQQQTRPKQKSPSSMSDRKRRRPSSSYISSTGRRVPLQEEEEYETESISSSPPSETFMFEPMKKKQRVSSSVPTLFGPHPHHDGIKNNKYPSILPEETTITKISNCPPHQKRQVTFALVDQVFSVPSIFHHHHYQHEDNAAADDDNNTSSRKETRISTTRKEELFYSMKDFERFTRNEQFRRDTLMLTVTIGREQRKRMCQRLPLLSHAKVHQMYYKVLSRTRRIRHRSPIVNHHGAGAGSNAGTEVVERQITTCSSQREPPQEQQPQQQQDLASSLSKEEKRQERGGRIATSNQGMPAPRHHRRTTSRLEVTLELAYDYPPQRIITSRCA